MMTLFLSTTIFGSKKYDTYLSVLGKSNVQLESKFSLLEKINKQTYMLKKVEETVFFTHKGSQITRIEIKNVKIKNLKLGSSKYVLISKVFNGHLLADYFFMANPSKGMIYKTDIKGRVLSLTYVKPWIDSRKFETFRDFLKRIKKMKK